MARLQRPAVRVSSLVVSTTSELAAAGVTALLVSTRFIPPITGSCLGTDVAVR